MIETLTAAEATERLRAEGMRMSRDTLMDGIRQGRFQFGDYVERSGDKAPWCYIYKALLTGGLQKGRREINEQFNIFLCTAGSMHIY